MPWKYKKKRQAPICRPFRIPLFFFFLGGDVCFGVIDVEANDFAAHCQMA